MDGLTTRIGHNAQRLVIIGVKQEVLWDIADCERGLMYEIDMTR
jgi:hypothetical protein